MNDLTDLDRRLSAIEDREAIRELIARYGPLADSGQAEDLATLWAPDGVYEVVGYASATGHAEIAALIEGPVHQELMTAGCAHALGPVAIDLDGDRAIARGHSVVFRCRCPSSSDMVPEFEVHRVSANRWVLDRTARGWRVVHRTNALLDGTEAARILLLPYPAN